MLKKVLMIANPGSGKGLAPEYAKRLSDILAAEYDAEVDICETTDVGDATEWAKNAKSEQYDTVICLGGDGTVNEVINGLMQVEEPPLFSFVPIGTANDLGRVLGFEMDPDLAIKQFRELVVDSIDIGQVNDLYFMDAVAVGDIPTAVMETDSEKKNKFGYFAYVLESAKAVLDGEKRRYQVRNSNGDVFTFHSNAIIVALTSSIGGMENVVEHRDYKDGMFQFAALKGNIIESTLYTLGNEGGIPEGVIDNDSLLAFSDKQLRIELLESEDKIYANVDGDEGPALPLEIKVYNEALKVLKPEMEEQK